MIEQEIKFDGVKWLKKKGHYVYSPYRKMMDLIEINLDKNKVVLDAGCGDGKKTFYFSKFVKEIYGIDINSIDVEIAKEEYGNIGNLLFKVSSVDQLPFKDASFDLVYSTWVIEHLKEPHKFINECYRVLKPGGVLILWVPNIKSFFGIATKMMPLSFKVKMLAMLLRETEEEVPHRECYYRANSVRKLDKLCKGMFRRIYLQRFDNLDLVRYYKILFYLWLIKYKVMNNNKLLNWMNARFYVEFKRI